MRHYFTPEQRVLLKDLILNRAGSVICGTYVFNPGWSDQRLASEVLTGPGPHPSLGAVQHYRQKLGGPVRRKRAKEEVEQAAEASPAADEAILAIVSGIHADIALLREQVGALIRLQEKVLKAQYPALGEAIDRRYRNVAS